MNESDDTEKGNLDQKLSQLRVLKNERLVQAEKEMYTHIFIDEILISMVNELKVSFSSTKFSIATKKLAAKKIFQQYPSLGDNGYDEVIFFIFFLIFNLEKDLP